MIDGRRKIVCETDRSCPVGLIAVELLIDSLINRTDLRKTDGLHAIKYLIPSLSAHLFDDDEPPIMLSLSLSASADQLTSGYLKQATFKRGRMVNDYTIEEEQRGAIPQSSNSQTYTIVRISSDLGGKFLVFRYDSGHWRAKDYDAKEQYLKSKKAEQGAGANP